MKYWHNIYSYPRLYSIIGVNQRGKKSYFIFSHKNMVIKEADEGDTNGDLSLHKFLSIISTKPDN